MDVLKYQDAIIRIINDPSEDYIIAYNNIL